MIGLVIGLSLGVSGKQNGNPTLKRLKAASVAAAGNNPMELPDLASPPTVTFNAATNASLQAAIGITESALIYKTSGKLFKHTTSKRTWESHLSVQPRTDGSLKINVGGLTTDPAVPANGYDQMNNFNVRLKATGLQTLEVRLANVSANAPCRFIVDGQFVARDGFAINGSTNGYIQLAWGSPGTHEIEIEVGTGQPIDGIRMNAGAALVEPTRRPKAVVVGTSFEESLLIGKYTTGTWIKDAAGVTRFAPWDGHFATFCKLNGYDFRNSALGGTGYSATAGAQNIVGQMDYWIDDDSYDLIAFGGPYNDKDLNQATMRTNARAAWEKARLNQPNAIILVHGCCGGAGVTNDSSSTITAEANLKAEFDAWVAAGEKKAYFIPVSPNYASALIKDTTYQDWISTDNTHPYRGDATHGHVGLGYYFNTKWRALIGA